MNKSWSQKCTNRIKLEINLFAAAVCLIKDLGGKSSHTYWLVVLLIEGQPVIKSHHLQWRQTGHIIGQTNFCKVPSDKCQWSIFSWNERNKNGISVTKWPSICYSPTCCYGKNSFACVLNDLCESNQECRWKETRPSIIIYYWWLHSNHL